MRVFLRSAVDSAGPGPGPPMGLGPHMGPYWPALGLGGGGGMSHTGVGVRGGVGACHMTGAGVRGGGGMSHYWHTGG